MWGTDDDCATPLYSLSLRGRNTLNIAIWTSYVVLEDPGSVD